LTAPHQRVSPAKYFAAFRRISRSSSSSRTFLRRAAFSASSGVGGSAGACDRRPRGRLAPAARTQLRKVSGLNQIGSDLPDRRLGPRLVQRDRVRLELRRIVLHDHEMSILRSSGSSVSCVQNQGSRPGGVARGRPPVAKEFIGRWLKTFARGTPDAVNAHLDRLVEHTEADELVLMAITHTPELRRRSYELIADAYDFPAQLSTEGMEEPSTLDPGGALPMGLRWLDKQGPSSVDQARTAATAPPG
jgi:hypothetical protein